MPFFLGCIVYNFFPGHMGAAGAAVLRFLVYAGAVMQVGRITRHHAHHAWVTTPVLRVR